MSIGMGSGTLSGRGKGDDMGRVLSGRGAQVARSGAGIT